MILKFENKFLNIGDFELEMPWPILDVADDGQRIFVLLDPESYLGDKDYVAGRRSGLPPIKNLLAFSQKGDLLWSAEFPSEVDYYYKISSLHPLTVNSFSSFRCEIDSRNGEIIRREFFK